MERDGRAGEMRPLSDLVGEEREHLLAGTGAAERERFDAAARRRDVFKAWNDVCAGSREGSHVTGLHYVPDTNELIVYLDTAVWAQEMSMLREIIRARMANNGVDVSGIVCKVTHRPVEKRRAGSWRAADDGAPAVAHPVDLVEISEQEQEEIEQSVSGIGDKSLRKALENAMIASYKCNKSKNQLKTS